MGTALVCAHPKAFSNSGHAENTRLKAWNLPFNRHLRSIPAVVRASDVNRTAVISSIFLHLLFFNHYYTLTK
jgi:hypothetical protein